MKDKKIEVLKRTTLTCPDAVRFDFDILYGSKLSAIDLKKSLMAFPAIAAQRLVLVREVEKFKDPHQAIILECLAQKPTHVVIILDVNGPGGRNKFMTAVRKAGKVLYEEKPSSATVFDVTRSLSSRKLTEALKVLSDLMADGQHPLQLMGGLVWFWGKERARIPEERFKKGLLVLQEADLNIKRSRLSPTVAVEVAVVKLYSLING